MPSCAFKFGTILPAGDSTQRRQLLAQYCDMAISMEGGGLGTADEMNRAVQIGRGVVLEAPLVESFMRLAFSVMNVSQREIVRRCKTRPGGRCYPRCVCVCYHGPMNAYIYRYKYSVFAIGEL